MEKVRRRALSVASSQNRPGSTMLNRAFFTRIATKRSAAVFQLRIRIGLRRRAQLLVGVIDEFASHDAISRKGRLGEADLLIIVLDVEHALDLDDAVHGTAGP